MGWLASYRQLFLIAVICIYLVCGLTTTTTNNKCVKATHGQHKLFQNKKGDDQILICTKKNGVYRWQFIDGSPSLGEEFDPAKDYSNIVDNVPDADNDFYRISLGKGNVKCVKATHGQHKLFQNKKGDDQILICTKKNGVYRWQFIDGSPSLGEEFDPAKDCSDIVDNVPDADNDFYWISLGKGNVKVWCDVHTDGGGFMLIGMQDTPVSWNIPSNSSPVDPTGPPQWTSVFGNYKVEDFAVQISTSNNFNETRAHWLYQFNPRRPLGNLLDLSQGGCTNVHSGIGNIAHVKDILTNTVLSRNFKCSKFGPNVDVKLGWGRMNYCLKHNCPTGYAFLPGLPIKFDSYGSFSYSASSPLSGITHDATAFVGCDNQKCCVCYGPKGGRSNYCGPRCTSINGGTVTKQAYVWFWIRGSRPKRIWKRCMEFTMKNSDGKVETYFIDKKTGSAHKGFCSNQFDTLLNEGTLSVSNKENLENIPKVPGLLSYRQDNKHLYVSNGAKWEALSSEKEMVKLKARFEKLRAEMEKREETQKILPSCSRMKITYPNLTSGFYKINPRGYQDSFLEAFCDMTSKSGVGVTTIGHDSEQRTRVQGYEADESYRRKIVYKGFLPDIAALTKISKNCAQFIKYECFDSEIHFGTPVASWVSRQGARMTYWGGAAVNSSKCACGMTNSCAGGRKCNCDINDESLREDSGFLTDKKTLPVTELRFGDTGHSNEYGYHSLGKLLCWG